MQLKNLKKGDDDLEANKRKKKDEENNHGAPAWNSFQRFILQAGTFDFRDFHDFYDFYDFTILRFYDLLFLRFLRFLRFYDHRLFTFFPPRSISFVLCFSLLPPFPSLSYHPNLHIVADKRILRRNLHADPYSPRVCLGRL